ncbi:hypothetical protein NDU88_001696 [Pleurodeles waltl]|uniref:Uncharacterized protein n=1 Tax=Pleurodeles waltl TaxID=8319 RepID=A0AAV7MP66_PLEWA|nr:hypothetical protein NDU88_001696 [Pleurodeles waltl]
MAPCFYPPNLLVPRVHLGAPALWQAASRESPSSAGPCAVVRNPPIAGPSKGNIRAQRHFPTQWSRNCGEAGRYLLDRRVLSIHSLRTSPPIEPQRLWRRSHGPAPGHLCIFGGDTAIAGPASPPLGTPLGLSAGSQSGAQLEVRRAADHRTLPVLSVLLRRGRWGGSVGRVFLRAVR